MSLFIGTEAERWQVREDVSAVIDVGPREIGDTI